MPNDTMQAKLNVLTPEQMRSIIGSIQSILWLDVLPVRDGVVARDENGRIAWSDKTAPDTDVWNPAKEWDLEIIEAIAEELRLAGLRPEREEVSNV